MKGAISEGFYRRFLRLALINTTSNLMVPLAGIIDVAFLGHLDDIRHLAGVSLATVIFSYVYWSFGFLRMGTTGLTAQAAGRQDERDLWIIGVRGACLAVGFGLLLLLLRTPLREIGFFVLGADASVEAAGRDFFDGRIWGAPAVLLNFVLIGWFLGREQGNKVLVLSAVGNGANVVLDYWMIVKLGWASGGAGLATALSQYLMLAVGLAFVAGERPVQQLRGYPIWTAIANWGALRRLFALNTDILIRTLALVSAFGVFINVSAALGTTVLAMNTLMLQVLTLSAYFIDGLAFATESFAGMLHGQGDRHRLMPLIRVSGGVSVAVGLTFAAAFALIPERLFGQLTHHQEVIAAANQVVGWLIPVLGFGAIAFTLDGYFLGLTQGKALRNSTVIATLAGFAPMAAIAWWTQSVHLLWLAMVLFMAARGITLGMRVPPTLTST